MEKQDLEKFREELIVMRNKLKEYIFEVKNKKKNHYVLLTCGNLDDIIKNLKNLIENFEK